MNILMILGCFILSINNITIAEEYVQPVNGTSAIQTSRPAPGLSIIYPNHNQKVRGEIKIYGKARPGAFVKLQVSSTYFKKAYKGEKISKGEGPLKRLNRTFSITTDRNGTWILKEINLTNAGWEENFTIKATSEGKAVSVNVYDHTKPVNID